MVITRLTRNQLYLFKVPWVRIPPVPPLRNNCANTRFYAQISTFLLFLGDFGMVQVPLLVKLPSFLLNQN